MAWIYEASIHGRTNLLPCCRHIQRYIRVQLHGSLHGTDCGYATRITGIPEDDEGLNLSILQSHLGEFEAEQADSRKPTWQNVTYRYVFYGVPTFSNPTGSIMSLSRRKSLLEVHSSVSQLIISWQGGIICSS
jgi:hypothetical protein